MEEYLFADVIAQSTPTVEVFLLPNPWNYFPLNLIFGPVGWVLNFVTPISWVLWAWTSNIWNSFWYLIVGTGVAILSLFTSLTLLPMVAIFLAIAVIALIFFVILDGPVIFAIILFFVVLGFLAIITVLTSPIWLTLLSIFVPFDQIFYAWTGIMVFIVFWEIILPWFGNGWGLQETEIQDIKSYEDSDEFQYTEANM